MPERAEGGSGGRPSRALLPGLAVLWAPGLGRAGAAPRFRRGTARPRPPPARPAGGGIHGDDPPLPPPLLAAVAASVPRDGRRSRGTGAGERWSTSRAPGRRKERAGEAAPDSSPPKVDELEVRRCSSWLPLLDRRCMRPRAGCFASNSRLSSRTKKSTTAEGVREGTGRSAGDEGGIQRDMHAWHAASLPDELYPHFNLLLMKAATRTAHPQLHPSPPHPTAGGSGVGCAGRPCSPPAPAVYPCAGGTGRAPGGPAAGCGTTSGTG